MTIKASIPGSMVDSVFNACSNKRRCIENERKANAYDTLVKVLERTDRLFKEALPKFDWKNSALDSNAIRLLNEVPREVASALASVKKVPQ